MPVNRFWSSVGSVFAYLVGVGLLQYIIGDIVSLFGLLPDRFLLPAMALVSTVVPVVGTIMYTDWKWGWRLDHMGMRTGLAASAGLWLLGALSGAGAALLAQAVSVLLAGESLAKAVPVLTSVSPLTLATTLLPLFAAELVFRGAVVSRYQSDLAPREVLLAAPLTPFAWIVFNMIFPMFGQVLPNLTQAWEAPLVVFLTLLFLRTDSVWLSAGIRMGLLGAMLLLTPNTSAAGMVLVWGVAAVVLLALEWFKQQRMPRRVQPRGPQRGRVTRGPWQGPH